VVAGLVHHLQKPFPADCMDYAFQVMLEKQVGSRGKYLKGISYVSKIGGRPDGASQTLALPSSLRNSLQCRLESDFRFLLFAECCSRHNQLLVDLGELLRVSPLECFQQISL